MEYKVIVNSTKTTWYKNGHLHREDGPAVEYKNGNKYWYKNGYLHREDGPACEYANGDRSWYKNGYLHREDGPAFEYAGSGIKSWYLNGHCLSENQFLKKINPVKELTVNELEALLGYKIKVIGQ